jgi:V8-like Glu-specific endopeptidase
MPSARKSGGYAQTESAVEETEFPIDGDTATTTAPHSIRGAIAVKHPEELVDEITTEEESTRGPAATREDDGHDPISNGDGGNESAYIDFATSASMESDPMGGEGGLDALEDVPDFDERSLLNRQENEAVHEARLVDAYYATGDAQEFFPAIGAVLPVVAKGALATFGPKAVAALAKHPKIKRHVNIANKIASAVTRSLESGGPGDAALMDPEAEAAILEVVIGTDDRIQIQATKTVPWSRICSLLITTRTGQQFIGTGFLVSPGTVITAGHCVYMHRFGGWAARVQVIPGRNADAKPFGECTSTAFRSVRGWVDGESRDHDYGAIILPRSFHAQTRPLGAFGFAVLQNQELNGKWINTAGYPGDKPRGTMWWHARQVKALTARTIVYDIDTAGGQSGSAVWLKRDGRRIVVGIHTNGSPAGNSATRITTPVFNNLRRWRDQGM